MVLGYDPDPAKHLDTWLTFCAHDAGTRRLPQIISGRMNHVALMYVSVSIRRITRLAQGKLAFPHAPRNITAPDWLRSMTSVCASRWPGPRRTVGLCSRTKQVASCLPRLATCRPALHGSYYSYCGPGPVWSCRSSSVVSCPQSRRSLTRRRRGTPG